MRRSANEHHSIAELLDDPIAKLLMVSDGVNRCALQFELTQMAVSVQARMLGKQANDELTGK